MDKTDKALLKAAKKSLAKFKEAGRHFPNVSIYRSKAFDTGWGLLREGYSILDEAIKKAEEA